MNEEWRAAPGWPKYRVSDAGKVIGPAGRVLKPDTIKGGYQRVTLCATPRVQRISVHRLVLLSFSGPAPTAGCVVRHLDGNSQNNALANLRWGTRSENEGDKVRHGTSNRGVGNGRAKLNVDDVREVRRRIAAGVPQTVVARDMDIPAVTVNHIHTGRTWRHV